MKNIIIYACFEFNILFLVGFQKILLRKNLEKNKIIKKK